MLLFKNVKKMLDSAKSFAGKSHFSAQIYQLTTENIKPLGFYTWGFYIKNTADQTGGLAATTLVPRPSLIVFVGRRVSPFRTWADERGRDWR